MKLYKVIPYSGTLVLRKDENAQDAIVRYFDVIGQECVDGWEFHSACPVSLTKKLSPFRVKNEKYLAFIFTKDDNK